MANVSLSDVRDTINVSNADIPDDKLQKMINRAATTLALELSKQIDITIARKLKKNSSPC